VAEAEADGVADAAQQCSRRPTRRPSQSRHNQDGIYTAPMDHSYRAALAGNGNNGQAPAADLVPASLRLAPADPEPLPALREDSTSRILPSWMTCSSRQKFRRPLANSR